MRIKVVRIPPNVRCFNIKKIPYLLGPRGCIKMNYDARTVSVSNSVFFQPKLTIDQAIAFNQAALGVGLLFRVEINLKGLGYFVHEEGKNFIFRLGYSNHVIIPIPDIIFTELKKKRIRFTSAHFNALTNFVTNIRGYRYPSIYKTKGIFYKEEKVILKEGKKS
uniref:Ribosomal protein L6 n=1 Tax=Ishige okamurae TaxID=233772 RepID=A0A4Y5T8V2_9PHAE|nr:ribosomal protein L6 [Ishige okamurae]